MPHALVIPLFGFHNFLSCTDPQTELSKCTGRTPCCRNTPVFLHWYFYYLTLGLNCCEVSLNFVFCSCGSLTVKNIVVCSSFLQSLFQNFCFLACEAAFSRCYGKQLIAIQTRGVLSFVYSKVFFHFSQLLHWKKELATNWKRVPQCRGSFSSAQEQQLSERIARRPYELYINIDFSQRNNIMWRAIIYLSYFLASEMTRIIKLKCILYVGMCTKALMFYVRILKHHNVHYTRIMKAH